MDVEKNRLFICDNLGHIVYMNLTDGDSVYYPIGSDLRPTKLSSTPQPGNKNCSSIAVAGDKVYFVIQGDRG